MNILKDGEFLQGNQIFEGVYKSNYKQGNPKPKHESPIEAGNMERLNSYFLTNCPDKLQEFVWFKLSYHLGRRGREGWRELTKKSLEFKKGDKDKEYVTIKHTEQSKNYQGGSQQKDQDYTDVRMYGKPGSPMDSINSSVVQYTQTESNGMDWHSIGTPLVNCISLRRLRLFSLRFALSTVGFRSSIGTNGTIGTNRMTWHSIGTPLVNSNSLRRLRLFALQFGLSTAGFRSSIGTNGTIGTNRMTWHSIGTPLVNCISLRGLRLFSLRFGLSTAGFRSSIGTNGTIGTNRMTWHSIGTPLVNCISLRGLRLFSLRFGLSTAGFRSSISTNGTIGTNRMTWIPLEHHW